MPGRWTPLAGWRAGGTNRRAEGSLNSSHEEYINTCLLLKQGREGEFKSHWWLTGFPPPPRHAPQPGLSKCSNTACLASQLQTGARTATTKEKAGLWDAEESQTLSGVWAGKRQPLLAIIQVAHQRQSGFLTAARLPQPTSQTLLTTFNSPSCTSTAGCRSWEGEEHTLKGNRASSDPTFRISSAPATWDLTPQLIGQKQPLSIGEALLHIGSGPSLSISNPSSLQDDSCQHTLKKMWLVFTSNTALWPKPLGIGRLYRDTPTQGHTFKTTIGNCFT